MPMRQQLSVIMSRLPLLVVAVAMATVASYGFSSLQPKTYQADATLIVGQALSAVNPDYNQILVSQTLSATYATVATTRPVMTRVIEELGLRDTPDQLARRVSAISNTDGALLTIAARDGDPKRAADLANAVAAELVATNPAVQVQPTDVLETVDEDLRQIQDDLAEARAEIETLAALPARTPAQEARLDTLRGRAISLRSTYVALLAFLPTTSSNLLTIIQPAVEPSSAVTPRPLFDALLAGVITFIVVSSAIFVLEYFDDAIKDPDEVEAAIGLPTLAAIERMRGGSDRAPIYRLAALLYPRSVAAEAYRALRTNIEFAAVDQPIRTILVTSAVPSEGKSVTAANLAVVFAQTGRKVLLVDADLRKPGVHDLFALANDEGLTDLLRSDDVQLEMAVRSTEQKNLQVLTAGPHPPNPAELLGSQRMKALLATIKEVHDIVILDSPPLQVFTDAALLSAHLDGTVLVVESRRGRRSQIRAAREALSKANAHLIGVVLNGISPKTPSEYGRYYGSSELSTGSQVGHITGAENPPSNVETR